MKKLGGGEGEREREKKKMASLKAPAKIFK